ncbi:MAG: L-histidine N(alpha)-methyltransferase [Cyanobacteriota bacterium]|nr:L-histidine N(alpha)-methyltransferase [Cyanobacteriota bacterium]
MIETMTRFIDLHPAPADLVRLVHQGLAGTPRQLPAWLLYDAEGSRLFEQICQQPEYSLTRTETALLEQQASELAAALGPGVLVEFGAGNLRKVGPLLQALGPAAYVPLDISAGHLEKSCTDLQASHPQVPMLAICCDYSQLADLPPHTLLEGQRRHGFYPGSSIGNFSPLEAQALLGQFARLLGPGSRLLIGIDHPKPPESLEAAYNDAAGVSAAFARNLLVRLNRDLAGDFDPAAFDYVARWEAAQSRVAMALVSRCDQWVTVAGQRWRFAAGEELMTEYSIKYTSEAFVQLAQPAGWRLAQSWSDPYGELSLLLLERADF